MERQNIEEALEALERLAGLTDSRKMMYVTRAKVMASMNVERELRIKNLLDMSKMMRERGKAAQAEEMFHDAVIMAGYDM